MRKNAPDGVIATPPSHVVRSDRVEHDDSPISDVLYDSRTLDAYTIGVQAYVYGWPLVENYRVRSRFLDPACAQHGALNVFRHETDPAGHGFELFVTPNADLLYSGTFFDLTEEPLVLHVPDTGDMRYWTAQILDAFTDTCANVSSRSVGVGPGDYALTGPDRPGALPPGVTEVRVPTRTGCILLRTLFESLDDLDATREIQRRFTLTPLSAYGTGTPQRGVAVPADDPRRAVPADQEELSASLTFFTVLNRALTEAGLRHADEAGLMHLFARIGVGPGRDLDPGRLDSATREGLARAVTDGWKLVQARSMTARTVLLNGWMLSQPDAQTGAYGHDHLQRAGVAHRGIYANTETEYVALPGLMDSAGRMLDGNHEYTVRFEADALPPVAAYWSVTIYSLPDRRLPDHPAGRVTVNSLDPALVRGDDGSVEILVQHGEPEAGLKANWLSAPTGPFQLILRAYGPTDDTLHSGEWPPPVIERH
ncbi:DUF1254 domain-containing protein [Streptomyces sp. NPDC051784]|uniref:DUF1254 domain-containing protein n=1 Tax=Streptomyces sp. NPDC051784 TaxID=3155805 RepID=UPI00343D6F48